ncbi:MAG: preprotein translocase subunit SecY [Methyloprofundus sp.]|nr:preprotein translocase subunit SecY [Methyloprofundus sp.]MDT8425353.1 preprotein translocase subunit SecY [Methyloprofundus sp.]
MKEQLGNTSELFSRLMFVLGAFFVYRVGAHIPVPGIDPQALALMFKQQEGSILDMFNMFSGGALKRLSLFALGIMPYISASIIMQLMTIVIPALEQIKKEGESGRRKISQYTRYGTVFLATFQAVGVSIALQNQTAGGLPVVISPGIQFIVITAITLVTGTVFLMWLGEQITERGLGNGISLIIFAGIVAGLPSAIGGTLELARTGELNGAFIVLLFLLSIAVTALVVFVERGQRRIVINYPKRQQGKRMYAGQSSFLPLKLNMAGVIPPIFASSIILFPATIAGWFGDAEGFSWLKGISTTLSPGQPLYVMLYTIAIVFFCFFYTALVFNSKETAENLKKSGAFLPGIRPGEQTAAYIDKVMTRLTLIGAFYITAVCLLPEFLIVYWNVPFYFGGTSLLIIVVVVMDFVSQMQTHLMSQKYEGLMDKANLKKNK